MIQDLYQQAMKFAGEKHANQTVPGSKSNYLLHISNVVMEVMIAYQNENNFDLDFAMQTAILHDTLEDTETTFDTLELNFGNRIAIAVQALTKNKDIQLERGKTFDSLNRINQLEKEVAIVKLADRITNLQTPPNHWSENKISNYLKESKIIADTLSNKNEYLNNRLLKKIKAYKRHLNEL